MSENQSIYASPITWAIILILIIVLGITISRLFTFSDELGGARRLAEDSVTLQAGDHRTVVALSNGQSQLEDDLEASDAAQQSAIGAVYSTQAALSNEAATELANLHQMITDLSTSQAAAAADLGADSENIQATQMALNATFEREAANQQTVIAELQETQNILNATLESEAANQQSAIIGLQETQNALSNEVAARETSASELQATQAAFMNDAMTREAALQSTISAMQSTQAALINQEVSSFTPTPTGTLLATTAASEQVLLYVEGITAVLSGPGSEYDRMLLLSADETIGYRIVLADPENRYYQIEFDGLVGWVSMGSRIRVEGDLAQLPTVEPAGTSAATPTPTPGS